MKELLLVVAALLASTSMAATSNWPVEQVAAEFEPFIERNTHVIEIESADLNGDGLADFLVVLEQTTTESDSEYEGDRILLIIQRRADGKLELSKRSESAIPDPDCGGPFGDCFQGIQAKQRGFTIGTYGGSSWRSNIEITFGYSRRDKTWQLVRVESSSFHISNPEKVTTRVFRPPRDFGKIDIEAFDYDSIFNLGEKAQPPTSP